MVDRIKQVMEYYELTPGEFADALGASRSSLTHIFSGRNQPSLDFARRVLMAFPEVSSEWLIMGVGEMIKPADAQVQPKQTYVQTDLFATAEEELGWGVDGNNEELGMRNVEVKDNSEGSGVRSEESEVRSQMSEVESERGNGDNEELGMRSEESELRSQKSEVESEQVDELTNAASESPLLLEGVPEGRGSDANIAANPYHNNQTTKQVEENQTERGNRDNEELGMRNVEVNENRNVNSDQNDVPIVTNSTNEQIEPQEQKITTREKTPKMDTKQFDTKTVRQRRPLPSTSSESKIQAHLAPESRISDSREPIAAPEKKVVKIIFFYDDDSFKIYHP